MNKNSFNNQSIIITLDADALIFEKLEYVSNAGFTIVEINNCAEEVFHKIQQHFPHLRIGAGNVINEHQLEDYYNQGFHFASSPGFLPTIAQTAAIYSFNYLPGISTISEAMQVAAIGYKQARPYPANFGFCSLLNKYLPTLRLFPGDIDIEDAERYLNLPAVAAICINNPEEIKYLSSLMVKIN